MIRAKLISPTNVMLERPLFSPVDESEFFLIGRQEYRKLYKQNIGAGFLCGGFFFLCFAILIKLWRGVL